MDKKDRWIDEEGEDKERTEKEEASKKKEVSR
jgi:hypothetical protein